MIEITLFIASDNKTHKFSKEDEEKIFEIIKKYWKNFTKRKNIGCYNGVREESMEVIIYTLNLIFRDLNQYIDELKAELIQEEMIYKISYNVNVRKR